MSFILFAVYGIDRDTNNPIKHWVRLSLAARRLRCDRWRRAYGMIEYHNARKAAQTGTAVNIVKQFFELPKSPRLSVLSPYWSVKSTEKFEDAAIQNIEYTDFMCPDCLYLSQQLEKAQKGLCRQDQCRHPVLPARRHMQHGRPGESEPPPRRLRDDLHRGRESGALRGDP